MQFLICGGFFQFFGLVYLFPGETGAFPAEMPVSRSLREYRPPQPQIFGYPFRR